MMTMMESDQSSNPIAERLALGRAKLAAMGKTPQQRGREKIQLAVDWIYRWGFSSPSVIDILSGTGRCGFPMKLVRRGLCMRTRTASGGMLEGVPNFFLTLTALGVTEAERLRETLIDYEIDPYRVKQAQMRHDLLAQTATANLLLADRITDYLAEREIAGQRESERKVPDVVWIQENFQIAVEVELTGKWGRKLDEFVSRSVKSLLPSPDGKPPRFHQIAILSDSPSILKRYREAFSLRSNLKYWGLDNHNHWRIQDSEPMPKGVFERITWHDLSKS
jgi:hypothetical protein